MSTWSTAATPPWSTWNGRCANTGSPSAGRHGPYPTSSPTAAPLIVARFTKSRCRPCPARTRCTTTADSARTVGFPPRELRDLQLRVRAEQQTPEWETRYAVRSEVEGTIDEFAHGHGMRHCRYRGQPKPTCNTYSRPAP
ncbi:transposase [Embleya sp. NPDC056538]